jgi:hypothetical protein
MGRWKWTWKFNLMARTGATTPTMAKYRPENNKENIVTTIIHPPLPFQKACKPPNRGTASRKRNIKRKVCTPRQQCLDGKQVVGCNIIINNRELRRMWYMYMYMQCRECVFLYKRPLYLVPLSLCVLIEQ